MTDTPALIFDIDDLREALGPTGIAEAQAVVATIIARRQAFERALLQLVGVHNGFEPFARDVITGLAEVLHDESFSALRDNLLEAGYRIDDDSFAAPKAAA